MINCCNRARPSCTTIPDPECDYIPGQRIRTMRVVYDVSLNARIDSILWAPLQAGFKLQCEMLKVGGLLPLVLEPRSATAATVLLQHHKQTVSPVGVSIPISTLQMSYRCLPQPPPHVSFMLFLGCVIIWLLHNLVGASFDLFRYLLLGDQLKPWDLHACWRHTHTQAFQITRGACADSADRVENIIGHTVKILGP